jgi:guanylate kinase
MALKNYQDFKQVLDHYHVSDRAKSALDGLPLALIVAPTGAGKNTVIKKLLETGKYHFLVSDTTREPQVRDGNMEQNGDIYYFRSEEEVLADLKSGEFLEAAFFANQVYGTSIRELEKAKSLNKIAITDIEIVGTDNVMRSKSDAKAIFLIPPSFDEWMRRLNSRGHMNEHEFKNRLARAENEFEAALSHDYYHYVITENVDHSAALIEAIIAGKPNPHQDRGRELINHLQEQLHSKLD